MSAHTTKTIALIACTAMVLWLTGFQINTPGILSGSSSSFTYSILAGSKVSILGSTNINEFSCFSDETSTARGGGFLFNETRSKIVFQDATLKLSVKSLDCGNEAMNHNLPETLQSEKFPFILIDIHQAESKNGHPLNLASSTPMMASVYITLAGTRKYSQIDFTGLQTGTGTYHFTGSHDLSLADYNIDPPSALFGLIKVEDKITVKFDLLVSANANVIQ